MTSESSRDSADWADMGVGTCSASVQWEDKDLAKQVKPKIMEQRLWDLMEDKVVQSKSFIS